MLYQIHFYKKIMADSVEILLRNGWKGVRQTVTLRYKGARGGQNFVKKYVTVERCHIVTYAHNYVAY